MNVKGYILYIDDLVRWDCYQGGADLETGE